MFSLPKYLLYPSQYTLFFTLVPRIGTQGWDKHLSYSSHGRTKFSLPFTVLFPFLVGNSYLGQTYKSLLPLALVLIDTCSLLLQLFIFSCTSKGSAHTKTELQEQHLHMPDTNRFWMTATALQVPSAGYFDLFHLHVFRQTWRSDPSTWSAKRVTTENVIYSASMFGNIALITSCSAMVFIWLAFSATGVEVNS